MVTEETRRYTENRKIVERTRAIRTFLAHLTAYIIGNAFLGVWNALTYYVSDNSAIWFPLPLLFWGLGVIIHYWQSVVLFDRWWERDEEEIAKRTTVDAGGDVSAE